MRLPAQRECPGGRSRGAAQGTARQRDRAPPHCGTPLRPPRARPPARARIPPSPPVRLRPSDCRYTGRRTSRAPPRGHAQASLLPAPAPPGTAAARPGAAPPNQSRARGGPSSWGAAQGKSRRVSASGGEVCRAPRPHACCFAKQQAHLPPLARHLFLRLCLHPRVPHTQPTNRGGAAAAGQPRTAPRACARSDMPGPPPQRTVIAPRRWCCCWRCCCASSSPPSQNPRTGLPAAARAFSSRATASLCCCPILRSVMEMRRWEGRAGGGRQGG